MKIWDMITGIGSVAFILLLAAGVFFSGDRPAEAANTVSVASNNTVIAKYDIERGTVTIVKSAVSAGTVCYTATYEVRTIPSTAISISCN